MSDLVLVMREGRIAAKSTGGALSEEDILARDADVPAAA